MADAFVADLASGLVRKLISLATEKVIQAWNLSEDLLTLRERLESIDALLSDTYTKKLDMSSVQTWFSKLKAVAHVADVFMDQLAYEIIRQKVENHHRVRDFFVPSKNNILNRFKVANKIKTIHKSFDKISTVYFNSIQALYAQACVLGVVLPSLKQLRVLVLNSHYKELPSSMGNMKFLKHLDISSSVGFKSYKLPNYITKLYNLQTLRIWALNELPEKVCNLINLRHLVVQKKYAEELSTRYMFIGIQRLTCLQTLPHFVVSRKRNCLLSQSEGLKNLGGTLDLYGLSDVSNMEETSKAKLCEKSNIQCLPLDWSNNEDERKGKEYNNEDVIEGLRPHTYLKELSVVSFKGRKFASWITMMMNLVKITLKDCNNCDALPPLSHLPKLREIVIFGMHNLKVIGRDFCGGLASTSSGLSYRGSVKTVATMYPSLTTLVSTGDEDQISPLAMKTKIWCQYFQNLRELVITNLDSSKILETMSRKISSLVNLRLRSIRDRNGGSPSNVYYLIDELLETNSLSSKTLNLDNCPGLKFLTIGIVLEELEVSDCLNLTSINVVEGALKYLIIVRCPSLSELVSVPSTRSRLEKMILGPFSDELNEFPWPSFSSVILFPKLTSLTLYGWKKVRSILLNGELDDRLSSMFPALTLLYINDFEGVKLFQNHWQTFHLLSGYVFGIVII
ncbi:putative disease resistance protein RGA4 [Daucus carota subsp. sativus]|nr:PREDICTED: putative disease resistance protein RGA4 [Daucus carota subsp. sativus]